MKTRRADPSRKTRQRPGREENGENQAECFSGAGEVQRHRDRARRSWDRFTADGSNYISRAKLLIKDLHLRDVLASQGASLKKPSIMIVI